MEKFARISAINGYDRDFISSIKIIVIGAGAIGNEIVKNLALFGVKEILIFDFDKIEIHNLTRSIFFREEDIGRFKAETVAKRASTVSPETNIIAINENFWDYLTFEMLSQYSAVICAVDNFEARIRLNTLCSFSKKLFINTGIDHTFGAVEAFPFDQNINNTVACYECGIPSSVYLRMSERYSCGWIRKKYLKEKVIPTTTITSSITSAHAISVLFEYLNPDLQIEGFDYSKSVKKLINTKTLSVSITDIPIKELCPSTFHNTQDTVFSKSKRNMNNLFSQNQSLIDASQNINIEFSEPIILYTKEKDGSKKYFFDRAENYDETILIKNGVRSLDAKIIQNINFKTLIDEYNKYEIPSKFILCNLDNYKKAIIVEMINE